MATSSRHVLVVDDWDGEAGETVVLILKHVGIEASLARSGAEALDQLAQRKIKVALLPLSGPKDLKLLRQVRAQFPDVSTIMVGFLNGHRVIEEAKLTGATEVLWGLTTFDEIEALISTVERVSQVSPAPSSC